MRVRQMTILAYLLGAQFTPNDPRASARFLTRLYQCEPAREIDECLRVYSLLYFPAEWRNG